MDADGVLINGEKFSAVLSRELNTDPVKEKEFFTTVFQDCLVGKADLRTSLQPYLSSFGWTGDVDSFLEFWFESEHKLNEELMGYLQNLRADNITIVLATNQEQYRTKYMLEHMGFEGAFDKIYSSAHMGTKKPDHSFYDYIINDLTICKSEVIFWDDDPRNVEGAISYGIAAEEYTDFKTFIIVMNKLLPLSLSF